jgi:hypothetical protein
MPGAALRASLSSSAMRFLSRHGFALRCVGSVSLLALFCATGCGDTVTTEDPTSGAGATGPAGSSAANGSTQASSAGAGGGTSCAEVPTYIENLYQAAAVCVPEDPSLHCQDIVDGYCCPVVVESLQSPATQAYLDFLELTKQQCPEIWERCAVVDCGLPEPGNCVADSTRAGGHCSNQL